MRRPEHRRFIGDQAVCAALLPAARKLAKRLRSRLFLSPLAVLTDWIKGGGAIALVRVADHEDHITIWAEGGEVEYEFYASEAIDNEMFDLTTPPVAVNSGFVAGKCSTHKLGKRSKSTPLVAMCDTCSVPEREPPIPVFPTTDIVDAAPYTRTPFYWIGMKTPQYVWWPKYDKDLFVVSPLGAAPGYNGVGMISRTNGATRRRTDAYQEFYQGLAPTLYSAKEKSINNLGTGMPNLTEPLQVPRRAFTRVVDGVTIFCLTDSIGKWHFWRAGDWHIIPPDQVVTVEPVYPHWCSALSLGYWEFNSEGTRAVCCPFDFQESRPDVSGEPIIKHSDGVIRLLEGEGIQATENAPGVIEVEIDISLDRDNGLPIPVITIIRQERFQDTGRYIFYAAYLAQGAHPTIPRDTLITARFDLEIANGNLFEHNQPEHAPFYYPDAVHTSVTSHMVIEAGEMTLHRVPLHAETGYYFATESGPFFEGGVSIPNSARESFGLLSNRIGYIGRLVALNLPTLSWVVQHQWKTPVSNDASAAISVVAYEEEVFYEHTGPVPRESWVMDSGVYAYQTAPTDAIELWSTMLHEAMRINHFDAFCWHPDGHWSLMLRALPHPSLVPAFYDRVLAVDIVCYRIGGEPIYTTHKELYNAAFEDNRDYDWYHDNPDGIRGSFRIGGLWRARRKNG